MRPPATPRYRRLDWVLGAGDDPGTLLTLFSPIVEERAAEPGPEVAVEREVRCCPIGRLKHLVLGAHYDVEGRLQHAAAAVVPQSVPLAYSRRLTLSTQARWHVCGTADELPSRLLKAIQLHAQPATGVSFLVVADAENALTVVLPCSEIARACYSTEQFTLEGSRSTAAPRRQNAESGPITVGYSGERNGFYRLRARTMLELRNSEPEQMLRRALVYGARRAPRPLLIRPPYVGDVMLSGRGYQYVDDDGEVLLIISDLCIETAFSYEMRQRLKAQGYGTPLQCVRFAPRVEGALVSLDEIEARAVSDTRRARNYDARYFPWQVRQMRNALASCWLPGLASLRDVNSWAYPFAPYDVDAHRSIALSATFVRESTSI